jgi:hypothetical protein
MPMRFAAFVFPACGLCRRRRCAAPLVASRVIDNKQAARKSEIKRDAVIRFIRLVLSKVTLEWSSEGNICRSLKDDERDRKESNEGCQEAAEAARQPWWKLGGCAFGSAAWCAEGLRPSVKDPKK